MTTNDQSAKILETIHHSIFVTTYDKWLEQYDAKPIIQHDVLGQFESFHRLINIPKDNLQFVTNCSYKINGWSNSVISYKCHDIDKVKEIVDDLSILFWFGKHLDDGYFLIRGRRRND